MIHDADRSLAAWLDGMLPEGTQISFDAPDPAPARRPAVSLFLYDIAEDTGGLAGQDSLLRDADGRAVAWQRAVRRYKLSYLVTAWAAGASDEHELLGTVLAGCAGAEPVLPAGCLRGALPDAGLPVEIRCAPPGTSGTAAICQAIGIPPRAALTLVLVAPVRPRPTADLAPPAREIELGATALDAPPGEASGGPGRVRAPRRWERARITEPRA